MANKPISTAHVTMGVTVAKPEVKAPTAPADAKPAEVSKPVEIMSAKAEVDGPMSLNDVNAILADNYPGFEPTNVWGDTAGLTFALPGGGAIKVERFKVKKCANMEELRAYIDSVK